MNLIRVAFVGLPRLLSTILEEVINEHMMLEFTGTYSESDLEENPQHFSGDVLIWGVEEIGIPPVLSRKVMAFNPDLTVVALAQNGNEGVVWKVVFSTQSIGEVSPSGLMNVITQHCQVTGLRQ